MRYASPNAMATINTVTSPLSLLRSLSMCLLFSQKDFIYGLNCWMQTYIDPKRCFFKSTFLRLTNVRIGKLSEWYALLVCIVNKCSNHATMLLFVRLFIYFYIFNWRVQVNSLFILPEYLLLVVFSTLFVI